MANQPSNMRAADVAVTHSETKLSGFRLISQGQVKLWKAMLVGVFLAGLVGALAFVAGFNEGQIAEEIGQGSEAAILPGSSVQYLGSTGAGVAKANSIKVSRVRGNANSPQLYIASLAVRSAVQFAPSSDGSNSGILPRKLVESVEGGGLKWQEQIIQCAGTGSEEVSLWTAYGPVQQDNFTVTARFSRVAPMATMVVSRYQGVDPSAPVANPAGANVNFDGSCARGVPNANVRLTTDSPVNGGVRLVATGSQASEIRGKVERYVYRYLVRSKSGRDRMNLYLYDFSDPGMGKGEFKALLNQAADWATAGLVIRPVPPIIPLSPMRGDVNGDQQITPGDALLVYQYVIGNTQFTDLQKKAADATLNGIVTAKDAFIIFDRYLGTPDRFTPFGDANLDGVVDAADAKLVFEFFMKSKTPTPTQVVFSDVNDDGTLSPGDAQLIGSFVAGSIKEFPVDPRYGKGDVNQDDQVTPGDALLAYQYVTGATQLNSSQKWSADVTSNGLVTAADSEVIFDYFLGKVQRFARYGDVNFDKKVTKEDSDLIFKFTQKSVTPTPDQAYYADVNERGGITPDDARLVYMFATGALTEFPADPYSVVYVDVTNANKTNAASVEIAGIPGGMNQLYVAAITVKSDVQMSTGKLVASVTGGGLTWQEQRTQCSSGGSQEVSVWTAFGTVQQDSFSVDVGLSQTAPAVAAVVSRYVGIDPTAPVANPAGANTNPDGTCVNGVPNKNAMLTTDSSIKGGTRFVATGPRASAIMGSVKNYAQRHLERAGSGTNLVQLYIHDFEDLGLGRGEFDALLSTAADWATAGLVIRPTPYLPAQ